MSEIGDMFKEYRAEQQERRAKRLPVRTSEICSLVLEGFAVERLSDYQFRINDRLDLYPIHNRYHDIKKNKRGSYRDAKYFVRKYFATCAKS